MWTGNHISLMWVQVQTQREIGMSEYGQAEKNENKKTDSI